MSNGANASSPNSQNIALGFIANASGASSGNVAIGSASYASAGTLNGNVAIGAAASAGGLGGFSSSTAELQVLKWTA
jgi:hypothetical protein